MAWQMTLVLAVPVPSCPGRQGGMHENRKHVWHVGPSPYFNWHSPCSITGPRRCSRSNNPTNPTHLDVNDADLGLPQLQQHHQQPAHTLLVAKLQGGQGRARSMAWVRMSVQQTDRQTDRQPHLARLCAAENVMGLARIVHVGGAPVPTNAQSSIKAASSQVGSPPTLAKMGLPARFSWASLLVRTQLLAYVSLPSGPLMRSACCGGMGTQDEDKEMSDLGMLPQA